MDEVTREDLDALGIHIENKGGGENEGASVLQEWYDRIDEGVRRVMHEWLKREGDFKEQRRLKKGATQQGDRLWAREFGRKREG